jgi:hypothetical protein
MVLSSHSDATTDTDPVPTKARVTGVPGGGGVSDPTLHLNPRATLQWVLSQFDIYQTATSARLWASDDLHNRASLYRADSKLAVVVGDDDLAGVLRRLFPCHGWRLRPTPIPGTPLSKLHPALGNRIFNALAREGFTSVEEVAAVPDIALADLRGMGLASITAIRSVIAAASTNSYPDDDIVVMLSGGQLRELASLLATLAGYAEARGQADIAGRAQAFIADALPQTPTA